MAPTPSSDGDRALKPKEAAEFLGVTIRTLKFWRANRRDKKTPAGPEYSKHGHKTVRYRKADLIAWLEAGKPASE